MVGGPIVVEGRLWGVMIASLAGANGCRPDTEQRLAEFTELVATAIANAEGRAELTASRARIVAAADQTRRRIERDLHDGAQQRLVSLALQLRAAQAAVPARARTSSARSSTTPSPRPTGALDELREIARGIHPAILTEGGLGPALQARSPAARRSRSTSTARRRAAAGAGRGQRLLRHRRGADQRRQTRARLDRHGHRRADAPTPSCASRSATTASAAPTSPAAPAWSASRTA